MVKTLADLEALNIQFTFTESGKIQSLTIPTDCPMSDFQAWSIIEDLKLKATSLDISPPPPQNKEPDWTIVNEFRASPVFGKAFMGGDESLAVINAFTLLRDSFTTENINDLAFSFDRLRKALQSTSVGDFSSQELFWIKTKLIQYNFPLIQFSLE